MDVCVQVKIKLKKKNFLYIPQNLDKIHFVKTTPPSNYSQSLLTYLIIITQANLLRTTGTLLFIYLIQSIKQLITDTY